MIDASHIKVHPHAAGAKGGNQEMSRSKGGLIQRYIWPWMRMVCRVRIIITDGTTADCTQAWQLISGFAAEYFSQTKVMIAMRLLLRPKAKA
ncbi:hypothetical protein P618_200954 [Holospora obtusa F1]|uniref:Transposase n=1 Tax=Holospora obtusa F1 TaxID=1399147 RepID=W6TD70_HOLOB|nr:hypothetical protein P618_200954 [Holospora obtusa F1]